MDEKNTTSMTPHSEPESYEAFLRRIRVQELRDKILRYYRDSITMDYWNSKFDDYHVSRRNDKAVVKANRFLQAFSLRHVPEKTSRLLWIQGKPGTGKTLLAHVVANHLIDDTLNPVAYLRSTQVLQHYERSMKCRILLLDDLLKESPDTYAVGGYGEKLFTIIDHFSGDSNKGMIITSNHTPTELYKRYPNADSNGAIRWRLKKMAAGDTGCVIYATDKEAK